MVRYDPYAPPGREARLNRAPAPTLPTARFRRLGASDRQTEVAALWWDGFPPADRRDVETALSEMTDDEMRAWLADADVPEGTAAVVMDWVEAAGDRRLAAYLALLVERAREKPRVSLVESLTRLSTVG